MNKLLIAIHFMKILYTIFTKFLDILQSLTDNLVNEQGNVSLDAVV